MEPRFPTVQLTVAGSAKEHIERRLRAHHMKPIGSGAYARVWGRKDWPWVYKVGDYADNEAYLSYVRAMARSPANPFFPKIKGMHVVRGSLGARKFIVQMERLICSDKLSLREYERVRTDVQFLESILCDDEFGSNSHFVDLKPVFAEAVRVLRRAMDSTNGNAGWDLHTGNVMYRGKQLVITDPMA
jgi:hypothetical protein